MCALRTAFLLERLARLLTLARLLALARLRLLVPDLRVAYMSGHVDHPLLRSEFGADFIQKPFSAGTLLASVRSFLDARQPV